MRSSRVLLLILTVGLIGGLIRSRRRLGSMTEPKTLVLVGAVVLVAAIGGVLLERRRKSVDRPAGRPRRINPDRLDQLVDDLESSCGDSCSTAEGMEDQAPAGDVQPATGSIPELRLYAADWCGHCRQFKPIWKNEVVPMARSLGVAAREIDCTSTRCPVEGFPTVKLVTSSGESEYLGARTTAGIRAFIETKI